MLVDPRLGLSYETPSLRRAAAAALLCLREDPTMRPPLDQVALLLEGDHLQDSLVSGASVLYCTVVVALHGCTVHTVQYCTVLSCTVLSDETWLFMEVYSTVL